jgi:glutamate synthase domain-containing protein 1
MCGLVGFFDKTGRGDAPIGKIMIRMLDALCRRGPDSAGVALYGTEKNDDLVLRVKLGEHGDFHEKGQRIAEKIKSFAAVRETETIGEYLRIRLAWEQSVRELETRVEALAGGIEIVSLGKHLEIIKQVGKPDDLNRTYGIDSFVGFHAIGHTRMSTESRVDLSHSQPFWAHGVSDLASVHNGHITNYHKLRRQYEQRGIRFYTENDSEIIGVYLADRIAAGSSLDEALNASLRDFDGSYCYLAATANSLALVKDRFAYKPMVIGETEEYVTLATEEVAIRAAFPDDEITTREAPADYFRTWNVPLEVEANR